jgi:hypothetical protein
VDVLDVEGRVVDVKTSSRKYCSQIVPAAAFLFDILKSSKNGEPGPEQPDG